MKVSVWLIIVVKVAIRIVVGMMTIELYDILEL